MRPSRALRARGSVSVALAPVVLFVGACSFPTLVYVTTDDDGGATSVDAGGFKNQGSDAAPTVDATDDDAAASEGGVSDLDATASDATASDGNATVVDAGGPVDTGAPPAPDASAPPDAAPTYNCNCLPIQMYPTMTANCGLLGLGLACTQPGAFTGNPACGTAGEFITCVSNGIICQQTSMTTRVQQCMP